MEMGKADIVITHGGTGAIIGAVKKGKKVIAVPRLAKYGEHVDDHQLQLVKQFDDLNLICPCGDTNELAEAIETVKHTEYAEYILTDSFHGSVFSILNHKKFVTFNRFNAGANSRNSRIDSLCTLLGLSERRYSGDVMNVEKDINYNAVEEKLEKLRADSIKYLETALK